MAELDLSYTWSLARTVPWRDLARAAWKRAVARRARAFRPLTLAERRQAADALGRAPRLYSDAPVRDAFERLFRGSRAVLRREAERALAGEVVLFGRAISVGLEPDWVGELTAGENRRPATGDGRPAMNGRDPKLLWELGRVAHLLYAGVAARVEPSLAGAVRALVERQLGAFLDAVPAGEGVHYASPLEVAMRGLHWLGALELCGGAPAFPRPFVEAVAARLVEDAHFLAEHLEDGGACPANHLLGDLVGLYVLGLSLGEAPAARAHVALARRGLLREARRQVGPDGAHFEASTGYHRFALELLLAAHRAALSAGERLDVGEPLHRMFSYLRGYLLPDGSEPGFGDGDDARVLPVVPRAPRDHGYLPAVGVGLFADGALRPLEARFSEEALLWLGPQAARTWEWVTPTPEPSAASFPSGGVHVLRAPGLYVALRAGDHGQHGVGGHAHNDQLSLVVWAGGSLVTDAGTGAYTPDALTRDRFRSTGAHATLLVDGEEQSPLPARRPFALPDRARGRGALVEPTPEAPEPLARVTGTHEGYLRLPCRVRHQRTLTLHRDRRLLVVEDRLDGRGQAQVELRIPLAVPVSTRHGAPLGSPPADRLAGLRPDTLARLVPVEELMGPIERERVIELGPAARPTLLVLPAGLRLHLEDVPFSPTYGRIERRPLVSASALLSFPAIMRHVFVFSDEERR